MTIFGPLEKMPFEKCPRRVFFAAYYERRLFSSFALLMVLLAPSWPHVYARHKTIGFYRTGWPSPLQNPSKMLTFALGFPGGLCRKDPSRRHLGPIFGRPEASWWHLGGILVASWWHLRPIFDRPEASWWYLGRTVEY